MIELNINADPSGTLHEEYRLPHHKILEIACDKHLIAPLDKDLLKTKYGFHGRMVLTTAGLLNAGMSIETAIDALLGIIMQIPSVVFLVIGKTNPGIIKTQGERYRKKLKEKVKLFKLAYYVKFIPNGLELPLLLEYLHLTDIYLYTSKDPGQTVNEIFVCAMRCACPIISSPIPYAIEVLGNNAGIIFDFQNSKQLSDAVIGLLRNESLRKTISLNILKKTFLMALEIQHLDMQRS